MSLIFRKGYDDEQFTGFPRVRYEESHLCLTAERGNAIRSALSLGFGRSALCRDCCSHPLLRGAFITISFQNGHIRPFYAGVSGIKRAVFLYPVAMSSIRPDRILYNDEHLLIVNKLEGELVVAAGGFGKKPLFDFLKKDYPTLRVVHRLDFGTSGVIVFAKTAEAVRKIREKEFRGWIKTYRALAAGFIDRKTGTIDRPLPARTSKDLVPAVSHFKVLEPFRSATYVEVQIDTGRKHQIRQHLKFIGHPLLMDPLYGNEELNKSFQKKHHYHRFFLHAYSLDFPHPITGEKLHVEAPVSPVFEKVLKELRTDL